MNDILAIAGPLLALACGTAAAHRFERRYMQRLAAQETDLQARIATANRLNQHLKEGNR